MVMENKRRRENFVFCENWKGEWDFDLDTVTPFFYE